METIVQSVSSETRLSTGPRIVVVEDDPDILELLREVLEGRGFSVATVSHPALIHSAENGRHPDLFLVDMMLPGMSGVELAEELRSSGHATTPIIAMSASRLMLQVAANSNLFQETVAKPFDMSTILETVERYVE